MLLDVVAVTFHKPSAFRGWVGESGEYPVRRCGITAFDDERAVNYR
jgi:hypothetical protein